jgi:hypothetical protein
MRSRIFLGGILQLLLLYLAKVPQMCALELGEGNGICHFAVGMVLTAGDILGGRGADSQLGSFRRHGLFYRGAKALYNQFLKLGRKRLNIC